MEARNKAESDQREKKEKIKRDCQKDGDMHMEEGTNNKTDHWLYRSDSHVQLGLSLIIETRMDQSFIYII